MSDLLLHELFLRVHYIAFIGHSQDAFDPRRHLGHHFSLGLFLLGNGVGLGFGRSGQVELLDWQERECWKEVGVDAVTCAVLCIEALAYIEEAENLDVFGQMLVELGSEIFKLFFLINGTLKLFGLAGH